MTPTLVMVGGFLGAGKTRLLIEAAVRLRASGRTVGIITNDQGGELVDTRLARAAGFETAEIAGGCFCCRFSEFVRAAEKLTPDVILAEPVGSCTDLSATVLRPLRKWHGDRYRLAPLTVLVDAARARELLAPDADPDLTYLFRKQLAEAGLVLFSKADLYGSFPRIDGIPKRRLSVVTGEGVSEWLAEVLGNGVGPDTIPLEIDYERYAKAEKALGWLNWRVDLRPKTPLTPAAVLGPLLAKLEHDLTAARVSIAHLKVFDETREGYLKASVCRNGEEPVVEGRLDTPPSRRHALTLNLRAIASPRRLSALVEGALTILPGSLAATHTEAFRPAKPRPEFRI